MDSCSETNARNDSAKAEHKYTPATCVCVCEVCFALFDSRSSFWVTGRPQSSGGCIEVSVRREEELMLRLNFCFLRCCSCCCCCCCCGIFAAPYGVAYNPPAVRGLLRCVCSYVVRLGWSFIFYSALQNLTNRKFQLVCNIRPFKI